MNIDIPELPAFFGVPEMDLGVFLVTIAKALLGFVGFMFLLQIIWSKFLMMMAHGDEKKHLMAHHSFQNSIIGFVVVMLSVPVAKFIFTAVTNAALASQ